MSDEVVYTCVPCEVEISGLVGDPQELPLLYCPDCGEQMDEEVNWA